MESELVHVLNALACERIHKLELIVSLIYAELKAEGQHCGMGKNDAEELLDLFNAHLDTCVKEAALAEDDVYPPMLRHRLGAVMQHADKVRLALWKEIDPDDYYDQMFDEN